jgi:hypothetical protein
MTKRLNENNTAITLYNPKKQELIGIFQTASMAARYLFADSVKARTVYSAATRKGRVQGTKLGYDVAVRFASEKHRADLGDKPYLVIRGYPDADPRSMGGFHSTSNSMRKLALGKEPAIKKRGK